MAFALDDSAEDGADDLFYLSVGPAAAILLGMSLVPVRSFTVASNLSFAFVALIIVVAELGGRRAAIATAVTSTLSLDFFLTEPYQKLAIASKHDVIAFCGLALCGALSAGLASARGRGRAPARRGEDEKADLELAIVSALRSAIEIDGPIGPERVEDAAKRILAQVVNARPAGS